VLNGLLGFILGWKAFPAILVGLTLQAALFQFGGITTLGVNTLIMALPAVLCYHLFGWGIRVDSRRVLFTMAAFACGFCAVLISSILLGLSLYLTGEAFLPAAQVVVAAHFPVMLIEGVLTAACVLFLRRVKPELLGRRYG
jgi:cobalt/nickel transport system permease protein